MPKLKCIVLDADIWGWQASLDRSNDSWRAAYYYFGLGIPPQHWSMGSLKGFATFTAQRRIAGRDSDPFDEDGFFATYETLDCKTGKSTAERHSKEIGAAYAQNHLADVFTMIDECKERGIEVVLVRLPAHQCYRDALDKAAVTGLQAMIDHTRKTMGLRFLDYYTDMRFTDEHFGDCDHLNVQGAEAFTRILVRDLAADEPVSTDG